MSVQLSQRHATDRRCRRRRCLRRRRSSRVTPRLLHASQCSQARGLRERQERVDQGAVPHHEVAHREPGQGPPIADHHRGNEGEGGGEAVEREAVESARIEWGASSVDGRAARAARGECTNTAAPTSLVNSRHPPTFALFTSQVAKVLSSLAVSAQDAAGPFIRDIMPVLLEVLNSGNKVRSKG